MTTRWETNALINARSLHFETSHTSKPFGMALFKAAGKIMQSAYKSIYDQIFWSRILHL